jgi:hypothetical protein
MLPLFLERNLEFGECPAFELADAHGGNAQAESHFRLGHHG